MRRLHYSNTSSNPVSGFNKSISASCFIFCFFFLKPALSDSHIDPLPQFEEDILIELYNATNGPGWSADAGWLVDQDPCNWYGILCTSVPVSGDNYQWRVNRIVLPSNQLSGVLPASMSNLEQLEVLNLNTNNLGGQFPAWLGALVKLKTLILRKNQFTGAIPPEISNLVQLERLNISENDISGEIPSEIGGLISLKSFVGSYNMLSGQIPVEFGSLVSLESLYLEFNQLSGPIPSELGGLSNLTRLSLHINQLSGLIPVELGGLSGLQSLTLDYNDLSGELPSELGSLNNLMVLRVSGNSELTGSVPLAFSNLSNVMFANFGATDLCEPSDPDYEDWSGSMISYGPPPIKCFEVECEYEWSEDGNTLTHREPPLCEEEDQTDQEDCSDSELLRGNPIDCASGVKTQTEYDYIGKGPDPLVFSRTYRSDSGAFSSFLPNTEIRLEQIAGTHVVQISYNDVRSLLFAKEPDGDIWRSSVEAKGRIVYDEDKWVYTDVSGSIMEFDEDGRLKARVNKKGYRQTYSYYEGGSADGKVETITNNFGRTMSFSYDSTGRLETMTDPAGQIYTYSYDGSNLTSVRYPDNTPGDSGDNPIRYYLYENETFPNALTGIIDENGDRFATWEYDASGRAVASYNGTDANRIDVEYMGENTSRVTETVDEGKILSTAYSYEILNGSYSITLVSPEPCSDCIVGDKIIEYDANGFPSLVTNPRGFQTKYTYNARGLEVERVEGFNTEDPRTITTSWHSEYDKPVSMVFAGKQISYSYDSYGNLTTKTERSTINSNLLGTTKYTYNPDFLLETIDGPRSGDADTTTIEYDSQGNITKITNPLGHYRSFTEYDPHGNVLTMVDENGQTTKMTYDARQRLATRTVAFGTPEEAVTAFEYDKAGSLVRATLPGGRYLEYSYDTAHRLVGIEDNGGNRVEYNLDSAGNRTAVAIYNSDDELVYEKSSEYNALNQLVSETDAAMNVTRYAYDANGNLVEQEDAGEGVVNYQYDQFDQVVRITDPFNGLSNPTVYTYDALGQMVSITDPRGLTTTYTVDGLGNVMSLDSPDAGSLSFEYDTAGNRIQVVDYREPGSNHVFYTYDSLNRLTNVDYIGDIEDITYTYDETENGNYGIGRLTSFSDQSGSTQIRYDRRGNIIGRTNSIETSLETPIDIHTEFTYDLNGNITKITYPSGLVVNYSRNEVDQVDAVTATTGTGNLTLASNITYLPFGPMRSWLYGNGLQETVSYDNAFRVSEISVPGVHILNYGYDANNNIDYINDLASGESRSYDYDVLRRLTLSNDVSGAFTYSYDEVGNRVTSSKYEDNYTYEYSSVSNQLQAIQGASSRGEL